MTSNSSSPTIPTAPQAHPIRNHTPRSHHTPPISPFLSRSAEDMTNPSPHDSGHDSSYFNASGPGHPPSSRGNSDIDDQVDRCIRDQRFGTLISDNPTTNRPNLPQSHTTQQRDRNIALFHRLIANLPSPITLDPELFATARAYISDIAHSDPAHYVTYSTLPTIFRNLVLNNFPTAASALPMTPLPIPR